MCGAGFQAEKETDMTERKKCSGASCTDVRSGAGGGAQEGASPCREYNDIDPMDDAEMDRVIRELVNGGKAGHGKAAHSLRLWLPYLLRGKRVHQLV